MRKISFVFSLLCPSNKSYKSIIAILLFFLFYIGCSDNPMVPESSNGFAIYFLKDSTIKIEDILNTDLNELQLAEKPWLNENDIEFYDTN